MAERGPSYEPAFASTTTTFSFPLVSCAHNPRLAFPRATIMAFTSLAAWLPESLAYTIEQRVVTVAATTFSELCYETLWPRYYSFEGSIPPTFTNTLHTPVVLHPDRAEPRRRCRRRRQLLLALASRRDDDVDDAAATATIIAIAIATAVATAAGMRGHIDRSVSGGGERVPVEDGGQGRRACTTPLPSSSSCRRRWRRRRWRRRQRWGRQCGNRLHVRRYLSICVPCASCSLFLYKPRRLLISRSKTPSSSLYRWETANRGTARALL